MGSKELKSYKDKKELLKMFEFYMDEIYEMTEEQRDIGHKIVEIEDELYKGLTEKQKEQIEEIFDLEHERQNEVHEHIFIYAFSLGIGLLLEGMN